MTNTTDRLRVTPPRQAQTNKVDIRIGRAMKPWQWPCPGCNGESTQHYVPRMQATNYTVSRPCIIRTLAHSSTHEYSLRLMDDMSQESQAKAVCYPLADELRRRLWTRNQLDGGMDDHWSSKHTNLCFSPSWTCCHPNGLQVWLGITGRATDECSCPEPN
ncbi:hypothetical protein LZ31DRAFT_142758 [Colletotrichum somersetense]|nr:hypothetical protein LZ31DRAFT_142758 [Colletotrichum somersetense]